MPEAPRGLLALLAPLRLAYLGKTHASLSAPSVGVFSSGDAGPRGGSHVPVVGFLARAVCLYFALFFSLVILLVSLGIFRCPTQFLEVLGLFVTQLHEPASP